LFKTGERHVEFSWSPRICVSWVGRIFNPFRLLARRKK
jgi:hypothetical protein